VLTELVSGFNNCFKNVPNVFALLSPSDHTIKMETVSQEDNVKCGRIGLVLKDAKFKDAPYRYLIYPRLAHRKKTKIAEAPFEKCGRDKSKPDEIKMRMGSKFLKMYR